MRIKALLAALAVVTGAGAHAQAPIIIKFSHVVSPDAPKGLAAERFRVLAEQRTRGRVKVEVYPNSQLYKDKEELEALQLGAVQMLAPSLAKFAPLGVKEFEAFDLPYIFPTKAALYAVTEGPIGKNLLSVALLLCDAHCTARTVVILEQHCRRSRRFFEVPCCYWAPWATISLCSMSDSSSVRSVSGARTGPPSWPTRRAPAFTIDTA
jgi:hypothetical protein